LLAIRLFSVFLGFFTLIYVQKIAQRLKINVTLVSLTFIFSPFLLFYERIGMQETLLTLCLTAAVYYFFAKRQILLGIFLGFAILTKTSAFALIIFLLPFLVYKKYFKSLALMLLVSLLVFLGFGQISTHNSGYFGLISLSQMLANLKQAFWWWWGYQGPIGIFGFLSPPVFFECLVAKIFFPRYFLFVVPISILVFIKLVKKPWLVLLFLIPNLILCQQIIFDIKSANLPYIEKYQYIEAWSAGHGIKETAKFLENNKIRTINTEDIMITKYGLKYYYPQLEIGDSNYSVLKKSKEIADALKLTKIYNSYDVSVYRSYPGPQ
jgi:hypothetical protein